MKILILVLLPLVSLAATTGSITLQGVVPAVTSISIAPTVQATALDLSSTQVDLVVANITEKNNTVTGYKVTLASTNAGLLKNTALGSMPYTAKYNNTSFVLSMTPVQVTNAVATNSIANIVKALSISYTGQVPDAMMQGTYGDTLTFSITAN